jgi:hypothetical protein
VSNLGDLIAAVDELLQHNHGFLGGSTSNVAQQGLIDEKAYEAYIFGLCLKAVRSLGVEPTLLGRTGVPDPFIFRGGPGQIHSTNKNYGYAHFDLAGFAFEIHCNIEYRGTSDMTHELDISILRAEDAEACRQQPDDPTSASIFGAWECKYYSSALQKHLARAFVGLIDDLGNLRLCGFCSNQTHVQMPSYFEPKRRPYPHLVLSPFSPTNEDRFVNTLGAELKRVAKL